MTPTLVLALPFAGSVIAMLMPTHARNAAASFAAAVAAVALAGVVLMFPAVRDGGVLRDVHGWMSAAGLDLVVRVDGFAWMFAVLITGIGLLVAIYARYYMAAADPVPRFYAFLLAFMGAMLGVVLSGNLIELAFFWELTSLCSYLLIGYWHHDKDARRGARMSLVVTGAGGLALFVGVVLLGQVAGSYDLDAVLAAGERVRMHPHYPLILALILCGAFTKSAQFPFHFWLPHAMAAPTPVSAYLHSATMVKAGVFLLARLWPVLAGSEAWFWSVGGAGVVTLVLGAFAAMFQRDLKGVLAYSTISHLGLITLLLGLNSPLAAVAAVFHMINHATFKASLFMAAGVIDHETGTRNIRRLRGLIHRLPITGTLALVSTAAMAGVPLLNGFLSKEMFFAETVYISSLPWVEWGLPVAAILAGAFAVVYALRLSVGILFGRLPSNLPRVPHEPPRFMRVPIEVLVVVCLVVGIVPARAIGPILAAASRPVVGGELPPYDLAIWHGFNLPVQMSLLATALGVAGYLALRGAFAAGRLQRAPIVDRFDGRRLFETLLAGLAHASRRVLAVLGATRLQPQLRAVVVLAIVAAAAGLATGGLAWGDRPRVPATFELVVFWLIGMLAAFAAASLAKFHRLAALMMLAVVGLVNCLTFVWFSAPDLALTQLTVEVVTTSLFLLGLRWLPKRVHDGAPRAVAATLLRRGRDLVIAAAAGAGLAALSYAMLTRPAPHSIAPYYLEHALPGGGGRNVINVILVDFRALDTFGEIAVLGVVALTIYALLRRFRPPRESIALPRQQRAVPRRSASDLAATPGAGDDTPGYLVVPAVLARLVLPVALVVAAYLFLRGHDEPGGGFVAGLCVAIAILVQYFVAGAAWVEDRLALRPVRWIAAGLGIAVLTGAMPIAVGYPFLTTHTFHLDLPGIGALHVPSAVAFDAGVFAVVVGSTLLILVALAHQSIRSRRHADDDDARRAAVDAEYP
ncbi:MAG TPA: monovalent cation/H+ antiporter subunit A [Casimicrobiaceae bacterium]